jgi:hypothetical protein
MNSQKVRKKWHTSSKKLKQQFVNINNLLSQKDKKEAVLLRLKDNIGKAEEELRKIILNL